jgi:LacI family transcriptional regulator
MRREENRPRRADSSDVAARAGVSRSTVSKVLNGREFGRIPADTRQRVLAAAQELNYVRNNRAHALVTGRTQRIGVAINHPHGFRHQGNYHRDVLSGIFEGAVECNYNLLFHAVHHADWRALYTDIIGGSADGVLLVGNHMNVELAPALMESGFPTVFISHTPYAEAERVPMPHCQVVDSDNREGGYLLASHLLSLGHRHIGLSTDSPPELMPDWQWDRLQGIYDAIDECASGKDCRFEIYIAPRRSGVASAELTFAHYQVHRPTAIILINDEPGPELVEMFLEQGIRVPEDVSIVNYNSSEDCVRARVPLTSVWQPLHAIGLQAMRRLVTLLSGEEVTPEIIRYPVRLDIRASTVPSPHPPG